MKYMSFICLFAKKLELLFLFLNTAVGKGIKVVQGHIQGRLSRSATIVQGEMQVDWTHVVSVGMRSN